MLLAEPPPSAYDLHFRVFGFPVRVHPWFWIISLLLGVSGSGKADPFGTLIWMGVVFVSIVIHELGHAFVQRHFGGRPWITLYGLGGLASCDDCDRSPRAQVLISLAGPVAGFAFAAALLVLVRLLGHEIVPIEAINSESLRQWFEKLNGDVLFFSVGWKLFGLSGFGSPIANMLVSDLLYVNIWWGIVNLLPIYPLDGGRVSRELFTLRQPSRGIVQSLWLSVITAGAMAVYGVTRNSIFLALMFGYLAYASYQTLQRYQQYR